MQVENMSLEQVPADIWLRIVKSGLFFQDLFNLTTLNKAIHSQLVNDEYLWNFVCFKRWERVYADYEIPVPYTGRGYEKARLYYRDECLFLLQLELYDPKGEYNYDYFEKKFSTDHKFIPILSNYCKENGISANDLNYIDLSKISLATKLLITAIRISGRTYFKSWIVEMKYKDFIEVIRDQDLLPDYEQFWFKFSLFDDASQRLVAARRKKLSEIFEVLRKRVYIGMLINEENGGILKYDTATKTIYFDDQSLFERFLYLVVRIVLGKLSIKANKDHSGALETAYLGGYYLEDFSILRVYSNEVMGHPFLINAILMKVLSQFFDGMSIFVKGIDERITPIKISLSKNFLTMNFCSINILEKSSISTYELRIFHTSIMESRLSSVHHIASNYDMARYVSPVGIDYLLQYVLNLTGQARKSFLRSIGDRTKVASWFPKSKIGFYEENYKRITDLFSGNSTIRGLLPLDPEIGSRSIIPNREIIWKVEVDEEEEEETMESIPFEFGMFVNNSRFDIDGIIIARSLTNLGWLLEVLTKQGTRMVFKASNLTENRDSKSLKRFLDQASLEIVGLQYVKAYNGRKFEFYT